MKGYPISWIIIIANVELNICCKFLPKTIASVAKVPDRKKLVTN